LIDKQLTWWHDLVGDGVSLSLVEIAGGVCSPMPSGTLQCDVYRALRLPIIFVGDSQLGGISTSLSSLESLEARGYNVDMILQFQGDLKNHEFLQRRYPHIPLLSFPEISHQDMAEWYRQHQDRFVDIVRVLIDRHTKRIERMRLMQKRSSEIFWWPFTQHAQTDECTVIDSAYRDFFVVGSSRPYRLIDATASWWTQGCGHGHPGLSRSAAYAIGRYGHVLFPENTHELAYDLAEKLLKLAGNWANRVFFSDNGSTALEVAIKMALRTASLWQNTADPKKLECIGLSGSYHGDTIGAMDLSHPNLFNLKTEWYVSNI
jgi:dethiobiotin synthetase/adenosylmethionine--8-amino-7-oxononanoate aminotransferase